MNCKISPSSLPLEVQHDEWQSSWSGRRPPPPKLQFSSIRTGSAGFSSKKRTAAVAALICLCLHSTLCIDCEQNGWDMSFLCSAAMQELLSSIRNQRQGYYIYLHGEYGVVKILKAYAWTMTQVRSFQMTPNYDDPLLRDPIPKGSYIFSHKSTYLSIYAFSKILTFFLLSLNICVMNWSILINIHNI